MGYLIQFKRRPRWWLLCIVPWKPAVILLIAMAVVCVWATGGPISSGIDQALRLCSSGQRTAPVARTDPNSNAIIGRASVIDGDTIDIHGTRIRLNGIDAPESRQVCLLQNKELLCGQSVAFALADKIGASPVICEPKDRDRCRPRNFQITAE